MDARRQTVSGFTALVAGTDIPFDLTPQANSLLLAFVRCPASRTPTVPAGWTLLRTDTDATGRQAIHYKVSAGTETGYHLATGFGGTAEYATAVVVEFTGIDPAAPIDTHDGIVASARPTSITAPSLTTALPGGRLVTAYGFTHTFGGGGFFGTPSGMSEAADVSSATTPNPNRVLAVDDQRVIGVTSTGTRVSTLTVTPGYDGVVGQSVLLKIKNVAPNAPTLTAPANGTTIDRAIAQRFTWDFSDDDAGDSQSKFDLRYRLGAGAWTTVSGTTPNTFYDFAAGALAAGDYEWQVRTYDALGSVGSWSASSFFTAGDLPTGPTITSPTSGGTVGANPTTVTWSVPDQDAYELRRVADAAGSPDTGTVYWTSGQVSSASTRSVDVPFETNNRYEHIQLRVHAAGLWSTWTSIRVHVSYQPPPVADVTIETFDEFASIQVSWTVPAPGASEAAAVAVDVYRSGDGGATSIRVATGLDPDSYWTDRTPASGVDYAYEVVSIAGAGPRTPSGWVGASFESLTDDSPFMPGGSP